MLSIRVPRGAQRAALCALATFPMVIGACAGPSGSSPASRPTVNASAAEVAGPGASLRGLSFFDELETRSLVAHDDALEGALLLATGRGAATYRERIEAARALGLIDDSFNRPAREATTIGEVALMVVRVLDRADAPDNQQDAVAALVKRGVLPPPARTYQGLTGAQLVSILGAADDIMQSSGLPRLSMPRTTPAPAENAAPSVPSSGATLHTEPLPPVAPTAGKGPTAQATAEREAAERAQVEKALKAAQVVPGQVKKPAVWTAGGNAPKKPEPAPESTAAAGSSSGSENK